MINKQNIIWALESLSSREEQERLWLSDGSSGEVGSFAEDVCELFDHGFGGDAMESGEMEREFSADVCRGFRALELLIHRFPDNMAPKKEIDHPEMENIRRLSKSLLLSISGEGEADAFVSVEVDRLRSEGHLAPLSPMSRICRCVGIIEREVFSFLWFAMIILVIVLVILWVIWRVAKVL